MRVCAALVSLACLVVTPASAVAGSGQITLGIRLVIVDSCEITSTATITVEPAVSVTCSDPTPYAIRRTGPSLTTESAKRLDASANERLLLTGSTIDTAVPAPATTDATLHDSAQPARLTVYY